jgi:hypothetical protein
VPTQLDRDRLMFEAGRRSMRRRLHGWRGATAVSAAGIGLLLIIHGKPQASDGNRPNDGGRSIEMVARSPEVPPGSAGRADSDYLAVRNRVLTEGLEAMSAPNRTSRAPARATRAANDPSEDDIEMWRVRGRS